MLKTLELTQGLPMKNTMELFDKALKIQHAAAWANELNLTRATFSMAKKKHRLSPVLAGSLAIKLGEDARQWIAIAALEAEPESSYKKELIRRITSV